MSDKYAVPEDTEKCRTNKCGHTAKVHRPYNAKTSDVDKCHVIGCRCERFVPMPAEVKKEPAPKTPPVSERKSPSNSKHDRKVLRVSLGRTF